MVHCSAEAVQHSSDICMASIDKCTAEDLSEIELRVLLYSSDGVRWLLAKFKARLVRESTVSWGKELSNCEGFTKSQHGNRKAPTSVLFTTCHMDKYKKCVYTLAFRK